MRCSALTVTAIHLLILLPFGAVEVAVAAGGPEGGEAPAWTSAPARPVRLPSLRDPISYNVSAYEARIRPDATADEVVAAHLSIASISSQPVLAHYREARSAYQSVYDGYASHPLADDALWYHARMETVDVGDYARAAEILGEASARFGGIEFGMHPRLGVRPRSDLSRSDLERRIAELQAAAARVASLEPGSLELAAAYAENGSPLPAELVYRKIIEDSPASPQAVDALLRLGALCREEYLAQLDHVYDRYVSGTSRHRRQSRRGELTRLATACFEAALARSAENTDTSTLRRFLAQAYIRVPYMGERVAIPRKHRSSAAHGDPEPDFAKAESIMGGLPLSPPEAEDAARINLLVGHAYSVAWEDEGRPAGSPMFDKAITAYRAAEIAPGEIAPEAQRRVEQLWEVTPHE